jgi:RNA polymerase sigma factor (sigma-70 family)
MHGVSPTEHIEDSLLVKAVLGGDQLAFKKMILQNERLVCSIVFRLVEGKEDREDICQEVFLRVFDKLRSFKFQSKLSTWIGNIAFNQAVNFLKKKKTLLIDDLYRPPAADDEEGGTTESWQIRDMDLLPDEILVDKVQIQMVQKAMEQLPPIQKAIVMMFHQEELSLEEIAVISSLPVNTVKSHLFRGRKALKNSVLQQSNS